MSEKQFRPTRERILVRIVELQEHTTPSGLLLSVMSSPNYQKGVIVDASKDLEDEYLKGCNVLIESNVGLEVRSQDIGAKMEDGKYLLVKPEEVLGMYI